VKKLTLLILRSFAGPMLVTFPISLFVLVMQFLWKYVDDLVGKGLGILLIMKLMFYVSVTFVPLALPLSLLLASIMTFGNLAEHFELTACKSAGVSLQRIMMPLTIATIGISLSAFFFSNYVLPIANLKMNALLYDVRQQKPALLIKEGIFYNGIDGYSIRIGKKHSDGQHIEDVMIYDHTQNRGNTKVILAEKGKMAMSEDERYLILQLMHGSSYEEQENQRGRQTKPLLRTEFEEQMVRFDLSSFKLTRTNEQLFKDNYQMLNLRQLGHSADSIDGKIESRKESVYKMMLNALNTDSSALERDSLLPPGKAFLDNFPPGRRYVIATGALYGARNVRNQVADATQDLEVKQRSLAKHRIEFQRKFTLSFACLILFFIGAPLGAIIRKGGLGMPVVVSIIFFVIYHVVSISGEKFAREGVLQPWEGMWLSSLVLLPIGIFLTYKSTTDSELFLIEAYGRRLKKLLSSIRHMFSTEKNNDS